MDVSLEHDWSRTVSWIYLNKIKIKEVVDTVI